MPEFEGVLLGFDVFSGALIEASVVMGVDSAAVVVASEVTLAVAADAADAADAAEAERMAAK